MYQNKKPVSKLIILDRDGVINYDSDQYIKNVDEFIPIESSLQAIAILKKENFKVAIATNQSGIGRGLISENDLLKIHQKLAKNLEKYNVKIDYIAYCPHHPKQHCNCRKPKVGLIDEIEKNLDIPANKCYLVGDKLIDLKLALAKNCIPVLVKTGKGKLTLQDSSEIATYNPIICDDLQQFVIKYIVKYS